MGNKAADVLLQLVLPSNELSEDMAFFTKLGFRLDNIFPADDPAVAIMSGYGLQLRIDKGAESPAPSIHLLTDDPEALAGGERSLIAPNGTTIQLRPRSYQLHTPATQHKFEVRQLQDQDPWVIGRAGMLYRDLIPDRLGGSIIASHIRIPNGGPVPDMVHYHTIGFQLIFCYRGWVKLVYEDQGPPFILHAGDCVTQPPEIRHQVLEASDNLEVIEIGVPAMHMTTIDHEMELPTPQFLPDRKFQGQTFCHHRLVEASWSPWRIKGFEHRDTGINVATKGVASVHVVRPVQFPETPQWSSHNTDILFSFVLKGTLDLQVDGHGLQELQQGDAWVMPPGLGSQVLGFSDDLEFLEVGVSGGG
ncbi:cupin domain-containing protein [Haliscomenobacter hydrossis]|uniref:Cupin domain-containing protein n=1 Tax=Haliscomenobacter hydrossis (strain ATCC 27775 / DSM 1100 / LMG 10767 / O) TaxID=760192 RepID=F4L659_HALH1|nr:cupin domain-containing protein [Haliscomenobacter hydrossis]AEE54077.1 cupin domain-containing protein [Haliscomenobacter hydrossis DSM 1100]